jgi:hypothetical protein
VLIFRRWKVSLPLLLLAIGATLFVAFTAEPDYTMTSYVQLIPAKVAPTDDPASASLRNPWNQLGLNTLGQASIYATQDQEFLDSLKASKHTQNFTLTMTYPNPIVTVEVVGTTPADARDTTQLVIDRLRASAESLQRSSEVSNAYLIATQRLDQGQNLLPSRSKVKRAILAVAAAGLVLTAGGTVGFDAFTRRRARNKLKEQEAAVVDGPPSPPEPAAGARRRPLAKPSMVPGEAGTRRLILTPADKPPAKGVPVLEGGPSDAPDRTAIIIDRSSSAVKSPVPKQWRPSVSVTYRSTNAQNQVNGQSAAKSDDHQASSVDTDGEPDADSSDRVVLQPKWVGENGGESK